MAVSHISFSFDKASFPLFPEQAENYKRKIYCSGMYIIQLHSMKVFLCNQAHLVEVPFIYWKCPRINYSRTRNTTMFVQFFEINL